MQSLRIVPDLRSSVVEEMPATQAVLFTSERRDSDAALLAAHPAVGPFTWPALLAALRDPELELLEVAEPLWTAEWVRALRYIALARALRPFRPGRRRVRVATYAIENLDAHVRLHVGSPAHPARNAVVNRVRTLALGVSLSGLDAIAFGTSGALENYRRAFPGPVRRTRHTVLTPRTDACSRCGPVVAVADRDRTVLFLGTPGERKGFGVLMDAWGRCDGAARGWRLVVADPDTAGDPPVGPGVTVTRAPTRPAVHDLLRAGSIVAMPSVRLRRWREQIGLPLVEGLAHGCRVVTTTETGLAEDLRDHPLVTFTTPGDPASLAAGLRRAMDDVERGGERGGDPGLPGREGHTKSDVVAWWLSDPS